MHDHSLGGPVNVGVDPNANHSGPCYDGVYGCHRCFNAANDGKGTISDCEWCHRANVPCRITKAWDEPVSYAICADCRKKQNEELRQMAEEEEGNGDWY